MSEEQITKALLKWLTERKWHFVCFDFPQSGTGKILHSNDSANEKNKNAIIPDLVAVRNGVCLFSENKDHFSLSDFEKQNRLIVGNEYSNAIALLLKGFEVRRLYFGIGLPCGKYRKGAQAAASLVDFVLVVDEGGSVQAAHNPSGIDFF